MVTDRDDVEEPAFVSGGEVLVHLTLDYWIYLECIQAMPQCGIYCDLQLTGR